MDEQEFIKEARKQGVTDKNIKGAIEAFNIAKKTFPDSTYEEMLIRIVEIQREEMNEPPGSMILKMGRFS